MGSVTNVGERTGARCQPNDREAGGFSQQRRPKFDWRACRLAIFGPCEIWTATDRVRIRRTMPSARGNSRKQAKAGKGKPPLAKPVPRSPAIIAPCPTRPVTSACMKITRAGRGEGRTSVRWSSVACSSASSRVSSRIWSGIFSRRTGVWGPYPWMGLSAVVPSPAGLSAATPNAHTSEDLPPAVVSVLGWDGQKRGWWPATQEFASWKGLLRVCWWGGCETRARRTGTALRKRRPAEKKDFLIDYTMSRLVHVSCIAYLCARFLGFKPKALYDVITINPGTFMHVVCSRPPPCVPLPVLRSLLYRFNIHT